LWYELQIHRTSAKALKLAPGKPACALFDAPHVIIAID
jgi:molybdopterin-binding protein